MVPAVGGSGRGLDGTETGDGNGQGTQLVFDSSPLSGLILAASPFPVPLSGLILAASPFPVPVSGP